MECPLSRNARKIESSLLRARKVSRVAHVVFMVMLAANLLVAALLFGCSIATIFAPGLVPGMVSFGLGSVPLLFSRMIACLVLYALARSFENIAEGDSPFTLAQSKRLFAIGCLMLAGVVAEALAFGSPAPFMAVPGVVDFGYTIDQGQPGTVYLNAAYLAGALISFCLSFVFKYGALLQQLSDDTV